MKTYVKQWYEAERAEQKDPVSREPPFIVMFCILKRK
jgi:hypothetical protein